MNQKLVSRLYYYLSDIPLDDRSPFWSILNNTVHLKRNKLNKNNLKTQEFKRHKNNKRKCGYGGLVVQFQMSIHTALVRSVKLVRSVRRRCFVSVFANVVE